MFLGCQAEDHRSEPIPRSVAAKYQQTNPRQDNDGAYLCVKIIERKNTKYQQTSPHLLKKQIYLCQDSRKTSSQRKYQETNPRQNLYMSVKRFI